MTAGDVAKITLDTGIGAAGLLAVKAVLPFATALLALVLIILRIVIGWQEYKLNRVKLGILPSQELEIADEPGA
jgi:hypothetical protein